MIRYFMNLDGERETGGPLGDLLLDGLDLRNATHDLGLEVLELVGLLGERILDLTGELDELIEVVGNPRKVGFSETTGGGGGGADTDTTGGERRLIAGDGVLVAGDVGSLEDGLDARTVELGGAQVDEDHVRVGTAGDELVSELLELNLKNLGVLDDLLLVGLELGGHGLLERNRKSGDGVVVGTTLVTREDTVIYALVLLLQKQ